MNLRFFIAMFVLSITTFIPLYSSAQIEPVPDQPSSDSGPSLPPTDGPPFSNGVPPAGSTGPIVMNEGDLQQLLRSFLQCIEGPPQQLVQQQCIQDMQLLFQLVSAITPNQVQMLSPDTQDLWLQVLSRGSQLLQQFGPFTQQQPSFPQQQQQQPSFPQQQEQQPSFPQQQQPSFPEQQQPSFQDTPQMMQPPGFGAGVRSAMPQSQLVPQPPILLLLEPQANATSAATSTTNATSAATNSTNATSANQ